MSGDLLTINTLRKCMNDRCPIMFICGFSLTGRAVAIGFAKEGADVVIVYLYEHQDAQATKQMVERYGK